MSGYELTQRAHCDIEEIDDFLAERDPKAAREFIIRVIEVFELLAQHPEAGRRRPELKVSVRSFPLRSHIVYYRIAAQCVQILRVGHAARDANALLTFLED
ncbi:MAG: type II toxin-antitoxin system RelE/ParE family toxin [Chthoniobacteraceae bacterium]